MAFLRSNTGIDTGPVVHGDGITLRMPVSSDYAQWARLRTASREFLTPWEPSWTGDELTRASFRRRVRFYQREYREDSGYAFFLTRQSDDAIVGGLTLSNIRRGVTQAGSVGYWIGAPYARRGYMSAGIGAALDFVFETLNLHRLEAACLLNNEASIKLLEKTGFQREGLARRYLKINGTWQDHLIYAQLDEDYKA